MKKNRLWKKRGMAVLLTGALMLSSSSILSSEVWAASYEETKDETLFYDEGQSQAEETLSKLPTGDAETLEIQKVEEEIWDQVPTYNDGGAPDEVFTKGSGTYGRSKLDDLQKTLYDSIDSAAKTFAVSTATVSETSGSYLAFRVDYPAGLTDDQKAIQTFLAYRADHPGYYWMGSSFTYTPKTSFGVATTVDYATYAKRSAVNNMIISGVKTIAQKAESEGGSDLHRKILSIHDQIVEQNTYAYDSSGNPNSAEWAHNVEGFFNTSYHATVCDGYAKAFALIMNYMGLKGLYISGKGNGGNHAWNAASFDGGATYYYMDLTWDDSSDLNSYMYFAMPKTNFEKSHTAGKSTAKGTEWGYDLPTMGNDLSQTYFKKYSAYAEGITDSAGAASFVKTAALSAPGTRLVILALDSTTRNLIWNEMGTSDTSAYGATSYGSSASFLIGDAVRHRAVHPVTAFSLDKSIDTVNKDIDGNTYTLTITSVNPAGSDDMIAVSSDNPNSVSVETSTVKAVSGTVITLKLKRRGTVTITARALAGGVTQSFTITVEAEASSEHVYTDSACTIPAEEDDGLLYAYGITKKDPVTGIKKNYKKAIFYTDLSAPKYVNAKGKTVTGKVVVGVTVNDIEPALVKNKIPTDAAAKKIASVSYSKGKLTITAKSEPGFVFVWAMTVTDKGKQEVGYVPVEVRAMPKKIYLLSGDYTSPDSQSYTSDSLNLTESTDIFVKPVDSSGSLMSSVSTELTIPKAYEDCIYVEKLNDNHYHIEATDLYENKKTKIKFTVVTAYGSVKANFTLTILNSVKEFDFSRFQKNRNILNDLSTVIESNSLGNYVSLPVTLKAPTSQKSVTATVRIVTDAYETLYSITDSPKVYLMGAAGGFTITKGKVKVTAKPSGEGKKIKVKLSTKSSDVLMITAPKKLSDSAKVFALIVYNTDVHENGVGYFVVPISVA